MQFNCIFASTEVVLGSQATNIGVGKPRDEPCNDRTLISTSESRAAQHRASGTSGSASASSPARVELAAWTKGLRSAARKASTVRPTQRFLPPSSARDDERSTG